MGKKKKKIDEDDILFGDEEDDDYIEEIDEYDDTDEDDAEEEIEEEIEEDTKEVSDENHYVDNVKFFKEMQKWKKQIDKAEMSGRKIQQVSSYIGECFLKISERLARRPNFINYPFKEEMIGDGIENCLMYAHNFDPDKSKNPFSYFTQIIYYAFIRRIEKEKKQAYIKYKLIEQSDDELLKRWFTENFGHQADFNMKDAIIKHASISENDISKFEPKKKKTKRKAKNKKK